MLSNLIVAALAFSAPPSRTRREMVTGIGAAAAAMISSPAFADPSKYAGSADRKRLAKEAAEKAARGDAPTEYQKSKCQRIPTRAVPCQKKLLCSLLRVAGIRIALQS